MPFHCVGLTYAESQREAIIQARMRQVEIAAAIQPIHQRLIHFVPAFVAKANQVERRRCGQFESIVFLHPVREFLRQFDVTANVVLQAFDSVVANHEPQFQRAKAAPSGICQSR